MLVSGCVRHFAADNIAFVPLQTPNMAICDANLVDGMPKSLTAYGGLDALVHALESCVSVCATDYTKGEPTLCSK